jgi:aminoglycoside N3'-acetyltransferase
VKPRVAPAVILDELGLERGDVVFVKASMNYLGYGPRESLELLERLVERVGDEGTILMPSFPYPNEVGRPAPDAVFDVRRSASQMGLITEMFRRLEGTRRSEQFWVPVCARGRLAEWFCAGQETVLNPFGEGSSYRRLVEQPTKMVGFGVTTNYNILAHVADAVLHARYPFDIFVDQPFEGRLRGYDGRERTMRCIFVSQDRRLKMKPSRAIAQSPALSAALRFFDHDGGFVWSLPGPLYFEESLRLGRAALDEGRLPPWLEEQH